MILVKVCAHVQFLFLDEDPYISTIIKLPFNTILYFAIVISYSKFFLPVVDVIISSLFMLLILMTPAIFRSEPEQ